MYNIWRDHIFKDNFKINFARKNIVFFSFTYDIINAKYNCVSRIKHHSVTVWTRQEHRNFTSLEREPLYQMRSNK